MQLSANPTKYIVTKQHIVSLAAAQATMRNGDVDRKYRNKLDRLNSDIWGYKSILFK